MGSRYRVVSVALLAACAGNPGVDGEPADTAPTTDDSAAETDTGDNAADTGTDDSGGDDTDTFEPCAEGMDADGDGWCDAASGGDDCDDADARVNPGAAERCDPRDWDCDGESLATGVCAETIDLAEVGEILAWLPQGAVSTVVDDVTGDGLPDLLAATRGQGVGVWSPVGGAPETPRTFPEPGSYDAYFHVDIRVEHAFQLGDATGDGHDDVAVVATWLPVGAFLYQGPVATGGAWEEFTDRDISWEDGDPGECWGCQVAPGDYDGDGLADLMVSVHDSFSDWDDDEGDGGLWIFRGGTTEEDVYERIGHGWGGDEIVAVGDISGDGYDDVLIEDPIGSYEEAWLLVSGPELGLHDGEGWSDFSYARWEGAEDKAVGWFPVDDLDGDDVPDLVSYVWQDGDTDTGRQLLFHHGRHAGSFGSDDTLGGWVLPDDNDEVAWFARCEGLFGPDAFVFGASLALAIPVPETLPARGTPLPDRHLRFERGSYRLSCGDLTGDGADDAAWYYGLDVLGLLMLPGWEVPWDEAEWW